MTGFGRGRNQKVFVHVNRGVGENLAVPNAGAGINIPWTAESFDPYGFHAPNSSDLVIPPGLAGFYSISCTITWEGQPLGGSRGFYIVYGSLAGNFSNPVSHSFEPSTTLGVRYTDTVVPGFQLQEGDQIRVNVYQNAGAATNILRGSGYDPALHMVKIS